MKRHECLTKVDKKLKESNTQLEANLLNKNHVFVATQAIEKKRGHKPSKVVAAYCPFCGEKLEVV